VGVTHQTAKTKPSYKRNPKTPPITIDSYQKGHKCMPKNTPKANEARKTKPRPTPLTRNNEKPENRYKRPPLQGWRARWVTASVASGFLKNRDSVVSRSNCTITSGYLPATQTTRVRIPAVAPLLSSRGLILICK
jgi:hypothetical protein